MGAPLDLVHSKDLLRPENSALTRKTVRDISMPVSGHADALKMAFTKLAPGKTGDHTVTKAPAWKVRSELKLAEDLSYSLHNRAIAEELVLKHEVTLGYIRQKLKGWPYNNEPREIPCLRLARKIKQETDTRDIDYFDINRDC